MNPFLLRRDERLSAWVAFRRGLEAMPPEDRLAPVAAWWAQAPLLTIAYDPEAPDTWPSPWEMVHAGDWCRNSVAIGMEATLRLSGVPAERLELAMLIAPGEERMGLVAVFDGATALNHEWGAPCPLPSPRRVVHRWRWNRRGYAAAGSGPP